MSSAAAAAQALQYPKARRMEQIDEYFGVSVSDPYRWMEDVDSPELKTWIDAENALTHSFLADVPERDKIHARLMQLNDHERFSAPMTQAGRYFYRRNTGLQNHAVLYWQQGPTGKPNVLLDPNALAADSTTSLESISISDDGTLMAYTLSEAGSDVQKVRVKNVATGVDLPDVVDFMKFSGVGWKKDGSGFYYSSFGIPANEAERADVLKSAAVFHKLYFHQLGTPQSADQVVFQRSDDGEMLVNGGLSEDGRWLFLYQSKGHNNALAVRDLTKPNADIIPIATVDDARYEPISAIGSEFYMLTTSGAPNGSIVKVDLDHPERAAWTTIVAEAAHPIESGSVVHDTLILAYLVDAKSEVQLHKLDGTLDRKLDLPGIGIAVMNGGKHTDTETFFTFTNYTTPPTVYRLDMTTYDASVWKQSKLVFDPAQYETQQVFTTSKDGTRVPLFITCKKGTKMDGSAPVLMHGYGGFSISLGPAYASSRLAWMEMGGIYAEAILRGGGEYGEKWHDAGTKLQKQNVFDDFIGCAE
jgi:prolyl oligopeptidase